MLRIDIAERAGVGKVELRRYRRDSRAVRVGMPQGRVPMEGHDARGAGEARIRGAGAVGAGAGAGTAIATIGVGSEEAGKKQKRRDGRSRSWQNGRH
jgi:hypothetical protein